MNEKLFESMSSIKMAGLISNATYRVIVVSPSIHKNVADSLISALKRLGQRAVRVILDCNEEVFRLGYGDIASVKLLNDAGCDIRQSPGIRLGIAICDDEAWIFTPIALYVQDEIQSDETPNAVRLGKIAATLPAPQAQEGLLLHDD